MNPASVIIRMPGGASAELELPEEPGDKTLSRFLEESGHALNTRCGGRGICRGCRVRLGDARDGMVVRACQTPLASLGPGRTDLQIPPGSWPDAGIHGVSSFDLRLPSSAATTGEGLALALDIGTTTLAGALWDLSDNCCLADLSVANPQRKFGDNVLSRISHSLDHSEGLIQLQRSLVRDGLVPLIQKLCRMAGRDADTIRTATAAGNPVMLHTLAGERLDGLSTYPFRPVFLGWRVLDSRAIGLGREFPITLLPGLGPFVGSDILAGALVSGMVDARPPVLLIDFGTNGEILLKHAGGYLATATAAGPAFEGGRLTCGAIAGPGIASRIARRDNRWIIDSCCGSQAGPKGISGAAYVDFLAIARDVGLLEGSGRFAPHHPDVVTSGHAEDFGKVIMLDDHIRISEGDVAELLQAKAAIQAGVEVLLELAGLAMGDLETVFVAGGFGYHLDPAHAMRIGLLPAVPLSRIETIGNASLGGASLALLADVSDKAGGLLKSCEIVELNQVPSFSDHYTDALSLGPLE
jgi:uncharacterized 2Fe-2S/4Fe-4S cluster protein (DUF4445 family)